MGEQGHQEFNQQLESKLEQSETDSTTLFSTIKEIQKAQGLLQEMKFDTPQYHTEALKKYENMRTMTIDMVQSQNKVTLQELSQLRKEVVEIDKLNDKTFLEKLATPIELINKITSERSIYNNLKRNKHRITEPFIQKDIQVEIERLDAGGSKTEWSTYLDTIVENLDNTNFISKKIHNAAQDRIIEKILKSTKGYNSEYIKGYNDQVSNYLIKIEDFEADLHSGRTQITGNKENPNEVNSKALASYISHLADNGANTVQDFINKFGENQLFQLGKLWKEKGDDKDYGHAKRVLENSGLSNVVHLITMFGSTKDFLNGIQNIKDDPAALDAGLQYYQNNTESIKEKFNDDMKAAFKKAHPDMPENKIEEKIALFNENMKSIITQLETGEVNVIAVLKAFDIFQKDNGVKLGKEAQIQALQIGEDQRKEKILTNTQKLQDPTLSQQERETIEKEIESDKRGLQTISKAILETKSMDKQILSDLVNDKLSYEDFQKQLIKQNKEYAQMIQREQKQKENKTTDTIQSSIEYTPTIESDANIESIYTLDETGDLPALISPTGESIEITHEEAENIRGKPEAQENLGQFKQDLDDMGMSFFFTIRNDIYDSMPAIGFDIKDEDYLSSDEMRKFISTILKSLKDELETPIPSTQASYGEFKEKVKVLNQQTLIAGQKEVDLNGYSHIEHIFREKFFPNDAFIMKKSKFQDAIQ